MLRPTRQYDNIYTRLVDLQALYALLLRFLWWGECPICGAKGTLIRWGHYYRDLVDWDQAGCRIVETRLKVQRFMCKHCHHTHAAHDTGIIAYRIHSLTLILTALAMRVKTKASFSTAAMFEVNVQTLYEWSAVLKEDLNATGRPHGDPNTFLLNWETIADEAWIRDFLDENKRKPFEHLRPTRPVAALPQQRFPDPPQHVLWPLMTVTALMIVPRQLPMVINQAMLPSLLPVLPAPLPAMPVQQLMAPPQTGVQSPYSVS